MKVALVQMQASTNKHENLKTIIEYIRKAKEKSAQLVAFPEFSMAYSPESQSAVHLSNIAETVDGDFIMSLRKAAKENSISVVATIYEKSKMKNRVYDTALFIDKNGKLSSTYRKLHLYDAFGFKESSKLAKGKEFATLVGTSGYNIGMMICYDIRFPEMSRMLALMGANILVIPSAWVQGENKVEHWRIMVKARAIENGCYVIAPDQIGNIYVGHSMITDPFGRVMIDMEEQEGLEVAELDYDIVKDARKKIPLLKNRRTDIYSVHLKR